MADWSVAAVGGALSMPGIVTAGPNAPAAFRLAAGRGAKPGEAGGRLLYRVVPLLHRRAAVQQHCSGGCDLRW
ncbi:hypothetical protein [Kitasatospora sp. NPDC057500]|uniref:hypothetical protein n=1 Tax=Kitasatospora sp. NPDC057500 TaxID=3346151 RepID=UPI00369345EC